MATAATTQKIRIKLRAYDHRLLDRSTVEIIETVFKDLSKLHVVGFFPDYASAYDAWKSEAQRTVDNAEMRYFILHAHKLLDPLTGDHHHL